MLWLSWIVVAVVVATLFSVVKTLDRLCYSVELVDARLDQLTKRVAELTSSLNAVAASATPSIEPPVSAPRDWLA